MFATGAQAQVECSGDGPHYVGSSWALTPSSLSDGDSFRLLFVTSTTRVGTATDIATYNTFVQTRAKAGHSAITDSCGDQFKVLGSTSAVDARDNTSTTGTSRVIYWLDGAKVADSYSDFYDGSWDSYAGKTEAGSDYGGGSFVLTGSNQAGTRHASRHLGATNVQVGRLQSGQNPLPVAVVIQLRPGLSTPCPPSLRSGQHQSPYPSAPPPMPTRAIPARRTSSSRSSCRRLIRRTLPEITVPPERQPGAPPTTTRIIGLVVLLTAPVAATPYLLETTPPTLAFRYGVILTLSPMRR